MWFLIENISELRQGRYPRPDHDTGYIDSAIVSRSYREPPENRVIELAAELDARLELVVNYISGWPRPTKKIKRRRKLLGNYLSTYSRERK